MENVISILSSFVADAVWCCAVVAALSLGCAVVWKWQDLAEGLKGEPKTFRAVFVAMLVVAATLFSKVDPNGAPPNLNAPLSGPAPTLLVGSPDEPVADIAKFAAINWTTNGVDLVLHRPESLATEAVEVTLAGSTNLVTATWEPFTNVVFAAGETNVAVRVDSAQLDAHSVSNMCFFAFINSGDKDEDGLADWDERFNLKIDPDDPDSDGDGMPDGWEWENGLNPGDPQDAWLDSDEDGLANLEEYGIGTDPREGDTDNDGLDDREEFGWIEPRGVFPDLSPDESTVYICSSPQGHVSQGVYPFSLPFPVRLCGRVCTVMTGILGGAFAIVLANMEIYSIFDQFQRFLGILTAGLGSLFFLGIFVKRVNGFGAIVGLVANYVVTFGLDICGFAHGPHLLLYGFFGLVVCLVVAPIASLFTPKGRD